jgi:thioredoxin-related protein
MFNSQTVKQPVKPVNSPSITWVTFEQAIEANKTVKKKIFIDVYTKWCGWCKVMDNKTFTDSAVAAYMNENYYCVKFDAEQKDTVRYKGFNFAYKPEYRSHELAISLLDKQMSYPSFVVLTESEQRLTVLKGYQEKDVFLENVKRLSAWKEGK